MRITNKNSTSEGTEYSNGVERKVIYNNTNEIFDEWCGFLNFFDSSVNFELSFMNLSTDAADFEKSIRIPLKNDGFNDVRDEYSKMLRMQLAQGNNGLTKTKYLTFGIEAESMKQAKACGQRFLPMTIQPSSSRIWPVRVKMARISGRMKRRPSVTVS